MEIRFEKTTPEDKDYFWQLHISSFKEVFISQFGGWDDAEQYRYFETKWITGEFKKMTIHNKIIGGIILKIYPDYHELTEIQIQPVFQNNGLGTKIIQAEIEKATRAGKPIRLNVFLASPAFKLYTRLGFRVLRKTPYQYQMEFSNPIQN